MKKLITMLALVLLFAASAQAATVTVLMDENFDSYAVDVDPATVSGSGWVNVRGAGWEMLTVAGVDGGTVGVRPTDAAATITTYPSVYSYAISDVTLGAGEFYRFEAYMDVPGSGNQEMVSLVLTHSDGRLIYYTLNSSRGGLLTMDVYEDTIGWNRFARLREVVGDSVSAHVRLDIGPDGVIASYDMGIGWVEQGQALVIGDPEDPEDDEPGLGFTGGLVELQVLFQTNSPAALVYADSLKLTVEAGIVAIPGDFDADNDVDGVDFGLWQAGYPTASGASLINGDADADGDVDGVDFGIWQANYPTNLGGAAAIPEPATLGLFVIGGLALLKRRK